MKINSYKILKQNQDENQWKVLIVDDEKWITLFETNEGYIILKDYPNSEHQGGGLPRYVKLEYTLRDIESGDKLKVYKSFTDFNGNKIFEGQDLTTVKISFLPYDGGFTWQCKEMTIYLQESQQESIVEELFRFVYCIKIQR